jgi:Domain of unknown function (DUF305)
MNQSDNAYSELKSEPSVLNTIIRPFASYLSTFLGMGFVSGSVVHLGETAQIFRFLTIGAIGMGMFTLSSYLQETPLKPSSMRKGSTTQYVFYSLMLAMGIGMISGGTQHFLDFPIYASYLLPTGFVLALIAYIIRNNLSLTRKGWSFMVGGALTIALPAFFGLHHYAQALPVGTGHHHGGEQSVVEHHEESQGAHPMMSAVTHSDTASNSGTAQPKADVKSDADYISEMIEHHQEAIATAQKIQSSTKRSPLKKLAENTVRTQAQEITQLRELLSSSSSSPASPQAHDHSGHSH